MKRRSFLGLLFAAPLAAPVIAKAAMAEPVARLSASGVSMSEGFAGSITCGGITIRDGVIAGLQADGFDLAWKEAFASKPDDGRLLDAIEVKHPSFSECFGG